MRRDLTALEGVEFDLVVIGGGIFGACAAWDAAQRGLSVALIERSDFGAATSANSYKVVHGGIRYLQHGDVARVRASSAERRALLGMAPHLVRPLPIVVPTYGSGMRGRLALRTGLALYDALTPDRNRGITDRTSQIPSARMLTRSETIALFPGLDSERLTGSGVFADGQLRNPPRLVLAIVRSAAALGATPANYVEATGLLRRGSKVVGVEARDVFSGASFEIRARVVLNAAGPYAEAFLQRALDLPLKPPGSYSRDVCFVVPKPWVHPTHALAVQGRTRDPDAILSRGERHLFVSPWRDSTLIGTWHRVHTGDPDRLEVTEAELATFVAEVNGAYAGLDLSLDDISMVNFGLVPFGQNPEGAAHLRYGHRSRVVDHGPMHGVDNLISLIGVRFTTGRREAERAVDLVYSKLDASKPGAAAPRSRTMETPVAGGEIPDWQVLLDALEADHSPSVSRDDLLHLAQSYGTEAPAVMALARPGDGDDRPAHAPALLGAQIRYAVQEEMAMTLADLIFRRTDLGTARHPGRAVLEACARRLGDVLGHPASRMEREIAEVEDSFLLRSPGRPQP
ncbi:MAG: glycerol-3-phosphate dehydrogenase/oxidase [Gemmatimonadales bacterium]|nr:MAG: glycerol-3-phosphate dehydrogenase/oxidase [Gemmatimonadales bacterium]